jgi:hypothetical protein
MFLVMIVVASTAESASAEPAPPRFETWSAAGAALSEPAEESAPREPGSGDAGPAAAVRRGSAAPRYALGVNSPTGWLRHNLGVSLSVGLGEHTALRANVARYDAESLLPIFVIGDGLPSRSGRFIDGGLGWVWYPRRLWSGPLVELGAVLRDRRDRVSHEDDDLVKTRSNALTGRALVGWSWQAPHRIVVATAAGLSTGYEIGTEIVSPHSTGSQSKMSTTSDVSRAFVSLETYVRIGFAFGD